MKPPSPLRAALLLAVKDLRAEFRSRQIVSAMGLFGVLTTMTFYFTLQDRPDVRAAALPGILWVTVIFAGTLGVGRNLAQEHDRGTLDGLLLAPIARPALFFGKLIVAWLFTLVVAAVVSLVLNFVFNTNLFRPAWWMMILLGTLGFATIGTLLGSMTVYARARETTLPILVLPVALPLVTSAVDACSGILENQAIAEWGIYALAVASLDVIFLGLGFLLFEYVVEE